MNVGKENWRDSVGKFRYAHSPIVEALCEFGFTPGAEWNSEVLSGFEHAFEDDFPRFQALKTIQAQISVNQMGVHQGIVHGERNQFVSEDGFSMVQIGPNTLTINDLKPYSGWDLFKPAILHALATYRRVANPASLFRAHLRYINRIELDGESVELDDWFQFSFRQPAMQNLPGASNYIVGANYPFSEHVTLKIEVANAPAPEKVLASMVDLEYVLVGENVLMFAEVENWLEEAHARIESAWLGSITEKLHLKYKPGVIQ